MKSITARIKMTRWQQGIKLLMQGCKQNEDLNQKVNYPHMVIRYTNGFKTKLLPALKGTQHNEPINFKLYERVKKHKRLQILKPPNDSNLFLEGEIAYSAPTHHKRHPHNTEHFIEMLSANHTDKREIPFNGRIGHDAKATLPERQQSQRPRQKVVMHPVATKTRIPPARHIPSIYSTLQASCPKNERKASLNKSVCNISPDKRSDKPVFYLDKKELAQIKAESFIVVEHPSMRIITGNRFKNNAEIASLTKIMTFYTIYRIAQERKIDLSSEMTTVDEQASQMTGTTAQLVVGDLLSIEQLLYGLMLPSGNDAAISLAKWGGRLVNNDPEQTIFNAFLIQMNKYAKQLLMRQSYFGNPHGLPNFRNTSNPYDLSLLIAACLDIPLFLKVVSTVQYSVWITNYGVKKEIIWENTNKLLRREGFMGVKTGVTVTAGPCLASCYQHDNIRFIVVLLRTNKLSRRFKQTRLILGWSLRHLDSSRYHQASKKMLKHDAVLDSDNSEDEQQFHYEKMDANELAKRQKILVYEL